MSDRLVTRQRGAQVLRENGFPGSEATLATLASRGGGPPFKKYGPRCLYVENELLAWARSRLSKSMQSTSELHVA